MKGVKLMKHFVRVFLLTAAILYSNNSSFAQWVQTNGPKVTVQTLAVVGKNLFAGTNNGVFVTTNSGTTWTQVNTGLADTGVSALASIGTNLFASTASGVFLTTNNGTSWNQVNNGLTTTSIRSLATVGTNLFASTFGSGIFASTNNGTSWTSANGSVFQNAFVDLLSGAGSDLFAATTSDNIIYRSTDNGTSWVKADSGILGANAIALCGSNLIAGGVGGVYLSTNNAASWKPLTTYWGLQNTQIVGFATSGANVYAVCDAQVLLGANNGTNWNGISLPSRFDQITSVAVIDTNIFIGTNNNSDFIKGATVWTISTNQIVTGVKSQPAIAPASFSLEQNYPNPFNPSTQIRFSVAQAGIVSLKVYDVLGREVATLVDRELNPSTYTVTWNAANVAGGAYFYRLQSGKVAETKKLLLMK